MRADRPLFSTREIAMLMGKFEFVRLASLRAAQLMRGCTARVPERYKRTTTAQREVAAGKVCGSTL